ncbi:MAG TPA: hypothetical protein VJB35_06595 [Candidatus Nanoarchaeia archaeon]|nr:hypothetical protein [Candidatus Nanoarchaeia archaeon]
MNLKNILKLFVGFYFVWFAIGIIGGVLSPANASQSPSTTMQMEASVPADEMFEIYDNRTMPMGGKETLLGWITTIKPTKVEAWREVKASAQKLGATCLIKMLEGEIVHLYEDKIKEEWYLYVLKAYYPRCPTSEVEGNIWLKFN